jgi:hypothetical protein
MRIRVGLLTALLASAFLVVPTQQASASCRDYPESITAECVAQNLVEAQAAAAAMEAKRIQDLIDAENRAKENAELDYTANGSRPCSVYPASISAACAAENLVYEASRQANENARREQQQSDAVKAEAEQKERDYIANGSRPCSLFPASITPTCVAENLAYEKERQGIYEKKQLADLEKAIKAEAAQQKADFIRNGSRPCSLYPASITAECAAQNLAFEEVKKVESAALAEAKAASVKSSLTTFDDNGSLLVQAKISTKVDLLSTKVKLLDSKGKVVDTGVIRYLSSGEPYIVFDNFTGSGNYKVQLSLPNKKFSTISIKVAK